MGHRTRVLTIATAGHVDHGKSSLVEQLTGVHPDRLPEERARGLSIALGYADLRLEDGPVVGFVDVPGHEKFVRTATAGATGVDGLMLVVAADDGVMPQTVEHADVARHLGVDRVAIVVTKIDRVDADRREVVRADAEALLRARGIASVASVFVSNTTGEGIDEVREALRSLVRAVESRSSTRPFRMSVARAFTKEGFGTVVTGVPSDGEVRLGDEIEVAGAGDRVRVRGIEVLGQSRELAVAGERTALNLSGTLATPLVRGDNVHEVGAYRGTRFVEVLLYPAASGGEVEFTATREKPREVRLLHGAAERSARGYIVRAVESGRIARFQLDDPLPVRIEDRVCLWSPAGRIIGGGQVVATVRSADPFARSGERAAKRADALESGAALVACLIDERSRTPSGADSLDEELAWGRETVVAVAEALEKSGRVVRTESGPGPAWISRHIFDEIAVAVGRAMRSSPSEAKTATEWAREIERGPRVVRAVLDGAAGRGLVEKSGDSYSLASAPDDRDLLREKVTKAIESAGLSLVSLDALAEQVGETPDVARRVRDELVRSGRVVRLSGEHFAGRRVLEFARDFLRDELGTDAAFRTGAAREKLGVNRPTAIALLEYFDGVRWTRRVDGQRTFVDGGSD